MRIQLRLSYEARVILEEEKLNQLKENISTTSGDIVSSILKEFKYKYENIDWNKVRSTSEYEGILADYTSINPTTLNLSDEANATIEEIRTHLNELIKMKRTVYRSYIIRIILKAYKLEKSNFDIYYSTGNN